MFHQSATISTSPRARGSRRRYNVWHVLASMYEAWRSRRILAELDPRMLKDIGVSRAEAEAEFRRSLWDFELRR